MVVLFYLPFVFFTSLVTRVTQQKETLIDGLAGLFVSLCFPVSISLGAHGESKVAECILHLLSIINPFPEL